MSIETERNNRGPNEDWLDSGALDPMMDDRGRSYDLTKADEVHEKWRYVELLENRLKGKGGLPWNSAAAEKAAERMSQMPTPEGKERGAWEGDRLEEIYLEELNKA